MTCEILSLAELVESGSTALFVRNKLTKPGSDFQWKLTRLLFGDRSADERDGMTAEEADEFLSFNTLGAYVGENGPVYVRFGK